MLGRRYMRAVLAGLGSGGAGTAFAVLALWLTTKLVDKNSFGEFSIALTITMILAAVLAAGPQGVVLYRCSRDEIYPGSARAYAGQSLFFALLAGTMAAAAVYLAAGPLSALFGMPGLADWLRAMAPIVALDPLRVVLVAWNQANQNPVRATLLRNSLPYVTRCLAVAAVAVVYADTLAPHAAVAGAYLGAVVLALIVAVAVSSREIWRPARAYGGWDAMYCLKLGVNGIAARPRRTIDVLLIGALASASATAEYMVASRLAQLPMMVKQAAELLLVPRLGMLLSRGDRSQLTREYKLTRGLMFMAGLIALAAFAVLGVWVLQTFGQTGYDAAFAPLMVLTAASLVRTGFGAVGHFLNISGYAGWTLWSTVISTAALVGIGLLAIPAYGALGGALAALAAALVTNLIVAAVVRWKIAFNALDLTSALLLAAGVGLAVLAAVGAVGQLSAGAAALACAGVLAWQYRRDLTQLPALVRARRGRSAPPSED